MAVAEPPNDYDKWIAAKRRTIAGFRVPEPRRIGIPDYLVLIHRFDPSRVRRVPAAAIDQDGLDEGGEFSLVACPCGAHPIVRAALAKCPGCERYYTHVDLGQVYLAYGAMSPP